MPITYNADTNIITITGFTEDNPCTFEDIYQADQSNGWGKVEKCTNSTYIVKCAIQVGDDSTETWFINKSKQVTFCIDSFCTYNGYRTFYGKHNSNIIFGELVDEELKITKNGCHFLLETDNLNYWVRFLSSFGKIYLYSTNIINSKIKGVLGGEYSSEQRRIWNCIFQNGYHWSHLGNTDIFNLTTINSDTFIRRPTSSTIINRVIGLKCGYGIWFQNMGGVIKNIYGRNLSYGFFLYYCDENDDDGFIINGDLDTWKSKWINVNPMRKVFRQYTMNLKVVDKNNNPIGNAHIILKDKNNNIVFEEITDINGKIPEQIVTYGYYQRENDGIYEHDEIFTSMSPHTLTITKNGFQKFKTTLNVDQKIDWIIVLNKENINIDQETLY